ncbi:MAG: hypothetical protein ACLSAP_07400 [Oscillospiraceae bacterium]
MLQLFAVCGGVCLNILRILPGLFCPALYGRGFYAIVKKAGSRANGQSRVREAAQLKEKGLVSQFEKQ